jgi:tetratricopeptide (TPR) repeat protein
MFVFLAIAFAGSFVLFGVGTGFGGLQDILLQEQAVGGGPSENESREAIKENPNNAQAHYDLSTALQAQGEIDEAIPPLAKYVEMRGSDLDAKRELAGLYLRKAERHRLDAQIAQAQLQTEAPGQTFQPAPDTDLGRALQPDAITSAIATQYNVRLNAALTAMQTAYTRAVAVYKEIVAATPRDPSTHLELAQTAEAANDLPTAITAYEKFVELAPEDQSAPAVRERIEQLRAASVGALGGG